MAWSGEGATLRSPLEQVWRQIVPQGHDAALRNAFYNVAAAGFVVVAGAAAWNVYLIFQPFVRALLWAVLCGSAMHPIKTTVVESVSSWLKNVSETETSLTFSIMILPLQILDSLSEFVGSYVVRHVRTVVVVTVVLPVVFIIIHYTPTVLTSVVYWMLTTSFGVVTTLVYIVTYNRYLVVALVCVYIVSLFMYWEDELHRKWLSRLSVAVWLLAGAGVAGWFFPSSATQLVFGLFCGLMLLGLVVEVLEYIKSKQQDLTDRKTIVESVVKVCKDEYSTDEAVQDPKYDVNTDNLDTVTEEEEEQFSSTRKEDGEGANSKDATSTKPSSVNHGERPRLVHFAPSGEFSSSRTESSEGDTKKIQKQSSDSSFTCSETSDDLASNFYLKAVLMACVLVELWRHHYLLALLPLALVYLFIKKTSVCLSGGWLGNTANTYYSSWRQAVAVWCCSRREALLPPPLRGIMKLISRCENCVVQIVFGSLDIIVTCFLILAALFFIVSASVFLAVQIQGESMQLVGVASQIINATVVSNPQFLALLPDDIGDTMSSALDNAYFYGRDWISKWVRGMVGEADEVKAQALEKQVLELWDRVYQAWVISPPAMDARSGFTGPVVTSQAVTETFENLIQGITNSPGLVSLESLSEVLSANVGTILSVLEGIWALLLSNISLVVSLATASASALLGSSLSLLNAIINAVVFLTALFYVLSSSGRTYKPLVMLADLAPGQMNSVGVALEQAINGVFTASLKMGMFYGLWTWLLHSIFGTNIVYVPAGALFGAVPLVGTYWACVPGLLELWWGHNSPTLALLLLSFQIAPLSCVDSAIYAEIKGGGHPYLTGLAVGGGIFCWGVEGAILGPLLLCVLLVATNLYTALISPPPPQQSNRFSKLRRNLTLAE